MKKLLLLLLVSAIIGLVVYFINPGLFRSADSGSSVKQEGTAPAAKQDAPNKTASKAEEQNLVSKANMDVCTFCSNGKTKCKTCGGTGYIDKVKCKDCAGIGYVNCSYCGGTGYVKRKVRKISGGVFGPTKTSSGKGTTTIGGAKQEALPGDMITCKRCKGTGYIIVPVSISAKAAASSKKGSDSDANGDGAQKKGKEVVCPDCKGQGIVMVPYKKN